jgi:hypothetical protein
MVVQTIGAWVTILAVVVGGLWALWRYRRQKPDVPRVNAKVEASLSTIESVDYITFAVTITHVSGDLLAFRRRPNENVPPDKKEPNPTVVVTRLSSTSALGNLPESEGTKADVLMNDFSLGSGEFVEDHGIVSLGHRHPDTIAYQVRFTFTGRSQGDKWTWSPNAILPAPDNGREREVSS